MIYELMETITKERPVGTHVNNVITDYLEKQLSDMGFNINSLPFECTSWEKGQSTLKIDEQLIEVISSPFSEPFDGNGKLMIIKSLEELKNIDCAGYILILSGIIAQSSLQPKNYPFYYPEEHKKIISLLEQKKPKAIIAATGRHPMCGMEPFPLFEDGNFMIASAYMSEQLLSQIEVAAKLQKTAHLFIQSHKKIANSRQLVASKKAKKSVGKIILCAHMDTKYNTSGALDNAVGVAALMEIARGLKTGAYDIDVVPLNGEEYYGATGELEYLKYLGSRQDKIVLAINIDSPCHIGAKTAVSFYNLDQSTAKTAEWFMTINENIIKGQEWYAGDHAAFAFKGIPCLAVTSSDLFSGAMEHTHTSKDTLDTVNLGMVKYTVRYVIDCISALSDSVRKRANN